MTELRSYIPGYEAKNMMKFLNIEFDYVMTSCGSESFQAAEKT
jgi:hypothetical protein